MKLHKYESMKAGRMFPWHPASFYVKTDKIL